MPAPYPTLGGPRASQGALALGFADWIEAKNRAASGLNALARME
jgi:hypothetical protein